MTTGRINQGARGLAVASHDESRAPFLSLRGDRRARRSDRARSASRAAGPAFLQSVFFPSRARGGAATTSPAGRFFLRPLDFFLRGTGARRRTLCCPRRGRARRYRVFRPRAPGGGQAPLPDSAGRSAASFRRDALDFLAER